MSENINNDSIKNYMVHYKKINIFGCTDVGKSSLILSMKNYVDNDFKLEIEGKLNDEKMSIGGDIFNIDENNIDNNNEENTLKLTEPIQRINIPIKENNYELYLEIYETNINEFNSLKENIDTLIIYSECIIFMIDITSVDSFSSMSKLLPIINKIKNENEEKKIYFPPMIFISNKIDLEQSRQVSGFNVKELIDKNQIIENVELSLYDRNNFQEFMTKFVEILQNEEKKEIQDHIHLVKLQEPLVLLKKFPKDDIKIQDDLTLVLFFLGSSTVGKTTFVKKLIRFDMRESSLTSIGIDVEKTVAQLGDNYFRVELWDTAGQERLRSIPKKYYSKGDGFLLLFDVTNRKSFNDVEGWIKEIRETRGSNDDNKTKTSNEVLFLIGNKIDETEKRIVKKEEAQKLADKFGVSYYETSCIDGINVYEIINKLIFEAFSKIKGTKSFFKLKNKKTIKNIKKSCCNK